MTTIFMKRLPDFSGMYREVLKQVERGKKYNAIYREEHAFEELIKKAPPETPKIKPFFRR